MVASTVLFIDGVPIPDDAHVAPAPQSASETQKRLLGAWVGTWNDSCRHILIVEDIRADGEARVVWANGNSSEWSREEGTVSGDILTVDGVACTYMLTATDMLLATCDVFSHILDARMSRVDLAALTRPGATINWSDGVEFLDTDLTEDGKRVRLEVVLLKPNSSGPFPLLVFNHGRICWGPIWLTLTLNDIEAAIATLQRRPDVAGKRLLIGGVSGGGILSIAYAGLHPQQIAGVINFVGGWDGERSPWAREINGGLFERGARYDRATLWLYGRGDHVFSIAHSRSNYETFVRAGGKGEFIEFDRRGHYLSGYPDLWREHVEKYLETLEPVDRP